MDAIIGKAGCADVAEFAALMAAIHDTDVRGVTATKDAEATLAASATANSATTNKAVCDAEMTTERSGGAILKSMSDYASATNKAICDVGTQVCEASGEGRLTTERAFGVLNKNISDSFTNTQNLLINGFKDGRFDAATNTAAIQLEAAKNAAASALAQCTNTASILLDSTKNAAASALAASVNTAAILAAQEKCCCELKELVRADGDKTRDLVQSIDRERASRELVDAKAEIFYLKSRVLPGTPV